MEFPKSEVRYHVVQFSWEHIDNLLIKDAKKSLQWHQDLVWSESESRDYIEYQLSYNCLGDQFYFNQSDYYTTAKAPFALIDGKQRLNAISMFVNNKLEILHGLYFKDFSNFPRKDFEVIVSNLWVEHDIIEWYYRLNYYRVKLDVIECMRINSLLDVANTARKLSKGE